MLKKNNIKILKFWWTSVWSFKMIKKSSKIIIKSKEKNEIIVVVSAMSGVTNILFELCNFALEKDEDFIFKKINEIKEKHIDVLNKLWECSICDKWKKQINKSIWKLEDIIKAVILLKQIPKNIEAKILYFWEILSSILMSTFLKKEWLLSNSYQSKDYLMSSWEYLDWECSIEKSEEKIKKFISEVDLKKEIPVFTWFWWWDWTDIYLYNRWWSDFVATIFWSLLNVKSVEIWTDASWIMTADPRIVNFPVIWKEMDYEVASEFALSWAKILHPKTLSPVQKKNIPVKIKNTFNSKWYWTKIHKITWEKWIKWINISTQWVILTFIDPYMIWAYWFIYSILKILEEEKVSIDVMATTETSFSISICEKDFSERLIEKLKNKEKHFILKIEQNICKISIVWDSIDSHKALEYVDDAIMISKWAYNKCLTIYTKSQNPDELLKKLHKGLFEV